MIKKSISVTDQQDAWIKTQIAKGHYGNDSEVIRELIRERQLREEETSEEIQAIRRKLMQAEQRGFTDISAEALLADIKARIGVNG